MNIKLYARMVYIILAREWQVYQGRLRGLLFNFLLLSPLKIAPIQGYVKPMMYFGYPLGRRAMLVFGGSLLMYFIHRSFSFATAFFFDIEQQHQVSFQARLIPLWLVYSVRVLFSSLFTWCVLLPIVPLCKFLLRGDLYTQDVSWLLYVLVMFLVALLMNSYAFMCISVVRSVYGISKVRVRLNEILMWLGAFNTPWIVMEKSSHFWGVIGLCNPFTYGSEALRGALVPGTDILPIIITVPALALWSGCFIVVGYQLLCRRIWSGHYVSV